MKDTAISYDIVQQQQQQQQQQHSWNQQRQQQQHQTHTTSVYANQSSQQQTVSTSQSQRSALGHQHHQQQGQHAAANQLGQYHPHHQLQSTTHHNSAAAYYQQAHLYPTYQTHAHSQEQQQQQPHSTSDHQHQVPVTGAASSVVNAVAAAQQQHGVVHHQPANNTQTSAMAALNHTGWSPSVGSMAPQAHHAVVTDHSPLAYMTHAYQSHNTTVGDHHRNSNGPMSTQAVGAGPQASSYAVDNLYNAPAAAAAAAAAAAYGYNNYNAFFQTSNNGPHTQTGHPSSANHLSTFWNHNQTAPPAQQRTTHSQAVANQTSVQQQPRQPIGSEQASNYMHDPRVYYGRATYGQNIQNFGQAQHHSQTQPQTTDVLHHRMTALSQQHQLLQHHEQQLHQVTHQHQQQQQLHHQSPISSQHQSPSNQQSILTQQILPADQQNQLASSQTVAPPAHSQTNRLNSSMKVSPQQPIQKPNSSELDSLVKPSGQGDFEKVSSSTANSQQSNTTPQQNSGSKDATNPNLQDTNKSTKDSDQAQQPQPPKILSPVGKPSNIQSVIKSETSNQYQRRSQTNSTQQIQGRSLYRGPSDDRLKSQTLDTSKKPMNDRDRTETKAPHSNSRQNDLDQPASLEDNLASLAISAPRKTTWASIASQPAKVSQPKSLKSKIAGSNSVLSSAKHLAAVSLDSTNSESKNGINPAIKSSVSAAATSIQRSSVPPPISKMTSAAAISLKLDILGEDSLESSRISWPAVNASVNLKLDDPPLQKDSSTVSNASCNETEKLSKDEGYRGRDFRDSIYKDHNHNAKMTNVYQPPRGGGRDFWGRRDQRDQRDSRDQRDPRDQRDQRDYRVRRDSDRKDFEHDRPIDQQDDPRESVNQRREFKVGVGRMNNPRGEEQYRERDSNKRGPMLERGEQRVNDSPHQNSRFPNNRFEPRDTQQRYDQSNHGNRNNEVQSTQHHHYNNIRDGNAGSSPSKLDLNLHPHLNPANFNPKSFNLEPNNARYFIIKSYSEDDIHRSIKYSIWCSTNHGNKRLDEAYRQQQAKDGPIYLFFSVNGSGHFCGMAQMMTSVDFDSSSGVWAQSKWQGEFSVKWIYVKDVPNSALRHITLENNEGKPVTNSRDTQEVPAEKGKAVLKILHQYSHTTSLFDDFLHYERRQEEEKFKKSHPDQPQTIRSDERDRGNVGSSGGSARFGRPYVNARSWRGNLDGDGGRPNSRPMTNPMMERT